MNFCKLHLIDESNTFVNCTFICSQNDQSVYVHNCVEECSSSIHIYSVNSYKSKQKKFHEMILLDFFVFIIFCLIFFVREQT